ncbi:cobaltochelatase subunit CobN [Methanobacterium petrolearium]|uniref:cobaltochelatase subunit CobN n=1 Tax=Methanobacterium petrolearium TaxID=710190 RepID=UPI001AE79166|nr:cobaltochelatase subunit CobN [Methanobacterium petrolearium]MBP1947047.1 parallel beta-helix repeat protein [Methanobacterium petrolearium]BDZ70911.1 hypothetical protein GCM10025861_14280 [Methanobacterium petrolearium]
MQKLKFIMIMGLLICLCANITSVNAANVYNISNDSYSNYFDSAGYINNTNIVGGDVLDCSGTISNKNMYIDRPLNITSTDKTALILNGTITILSAGSGTNITDLKINNSQDNCKGIYLLNTENNTIQGNIIQSDGIRGHCIALVGSKYNQITGNNLSEYETVDGWTHSPVILGDSHYNKISNNNIISSVSNCIYLCMFSFADYANGNPCTYNNIIANILYGADTSWCYGIQVMGAYNSVINNTVTGAYRGISSEQDNGGNTIIGNTIAATYCGIYFSSNCTVSDNNITGYGSTHSGITAYGSDAVVSDNLINLSNGYGIELKGSNCILSRNNITNTNNEGIYVHGQVTGNSIIANAINSDSTGVLLEEQSSSKRPAYTSITGNHITTTSTYAVDSAEGTDTTITNNSLVSDNGNRQGDNAVSSNTGDRISDNYGETPVSGANVHQITNDNYSTYFNGAGNIISSSIVAGDILDLSGTFTNKNMIIDRPLTIISFDKTALLLNGTITILNGGSGTNIKYLVIENSNEDGIGIFLYETENNTIQGNNIHCNGPYGFAIALTCSNNNFIVGNTVRTSVRSDTERTHTAIVLGESDNNTISGNYVESDGADCIYLSNVGSGKFESNGVSYYNKIINNTCVGADISWCYGIQVMGAYNSVINNTVTGAYRGISSEHDNGGNTIIGNTIAATYCGIYFSSNCTVSGNTITGYGSTHSGITAYGSDAVVSDNLISLSNGYGIELKGSNCLISGNNITTGSGEGICVHGQVTGNNIVANIINSASTGVLLEKQSSNKWPADTTITANHITTTSTYAVDTREGNSSTITNNYLISDNGNREGNDAIISVTGDTSNGNYGDTPFAVFDINDSNYSDFFNSEGILKNTVVGAHSTLNLWGDFYNRNMTITIPVTLKGFNAILHNGTIKITSGGSGTSIYNITIDNVNQKGIILFESENNIIENNTITVDDDEESYAIYLYDSRNNKIIDNNLTTTGDFITIALLLYESNNNQILSNTINTTGTSIPLSFLSSLTLSQDIGAINEIFPTYGILLLYSSLNNITTNDVFLTSGFTTATMPISTCMNSMVGIDIYYDSHNNRVTNNNITVIGNNPFSYGLGVLGAVWGDSSTSAEGNVFSQNNINVTGSYFATGFIAGLNSLNTIINENNIDVSALNYSYGITLESSTASNISKNVINTSADVNYAFELFTSNNNLIEENEIFATGNYSYGIAAHNSGKNTINKNNITTIGNEGTDAGSHHGDVIPAGNAGIYMTGGSTEEFPNNTISFNRINTTGAYAVNTTGSSNNTITYNYLYSNGGNLQGNNAVTPGPDDLVAYNYGESSLGISGTIRDAYDNSTGDYVGELADAVAVSNATVNLRSQSDNQIIATMTTDSSGYYIFSNLNKGNYILEILYRTYKNYLQNVTINTGSLTVDHTFIPDIAIISYYGTSDVDGQLNKMQALMDLSCRVYTIESYNTIDETYKHWMLEYANFILLDMYTETCAVSIEDIAGSLANENHMIAYIFGIYTDNYISNLLGSWNFLGASQENNTPNTLENTYIGSYWQAEAIKDNDVVNENMQNMLDYIFYLLGESDVNPTEENRGPILASATWGIYHPDYGVFGTTPTREQINEWIKQDPGYGGDGVGSLNWMTNELLTWSAEHNDPNQIFNAFESWYNSTKSDITGSFVVIASYYPGGSLVDAMITTYEAQGRAVLNIFQSATSPPMSQLLLELVEGVNGTGPLSRGVVAVNSLYSWSMDYANMANGGAIDNFTAMNLEIIRALNSISQYSYMSEFGPQAEWTYSVTIPQFEGVFGAIPVSYLDSNGNEIPVQEGIDKVVELTLGWAALKEKENEAKKIAVILYNYPPGKSELGASYLDVFQSLHDLLGQLYDAGYDIGMEKEDIPTATELYTIIAEFGNKGTWAQGLLDAYVEENYDNLTSNNQLVNLTQYLQWFNELPETLQEQLVAKWGSGLGEIMVYDDEYIVIPGLVCGNVFITVQPSRGWEEVENYHDATLPPHQQYVAFYKWLDQVFGADVMIHLGTHGTLEWLPGRSVGLQADDWTFQLSTIPNIYPYIVSNPGEAMVAKDRSFALVISHMTPAIVSSGLYGDLVTLHDYIHSYENAVKVDATELAEEYKIQITQTAVDLGFDPLQDDEDFDAWLEELHLKLHDLENDVITLGLHTLGEGLEGYELIQETITIASSRTEIMNNIKNLLYPSIPADYYTMLHDVQYEDYIEVIKNNMTYYVTQLVNGTSLDDLAAEIGITNTSVLYINLQFCVETISDLMTNMEWESIMNALSGGYIIPGLSADPSYSDVLPTGTNIYSLDTTRMPSKAAWEAAKKIVDLQLKDYYQEHGEFPETIAQIMWGTELLRTEGIGIAQFLYYLGITPTWSITGNGVVTGIALMDLSELTITLDDGTVINRPRIDVFATAVIGNTDWLELLVGAVSLVNATDESTDVNFVKKHYAENPSLDRIFGLPGAVLEGTGVSNYFSNFSKWENSASVIADCAEIYLSRISNAWTLDENGHIVVSSNRNTFEYLLRNTNLVTQNIDSTWRFLDSDDYYDWFGGALLACQYLGANPDTSIVDIRDQNNMVNRNLKEELEFEVQSMVNNPNYFGSLQNNPSGALQYASRVNNFVAFAMLTKDTDGNSVAGNGLMTSVANTILGSAFASGFDADFKAVAFQSIAASLLQSARKGTWEADPELLQKLANEYLKSYEVAVSCCHHTCGALALNNFAISISSLSMVQLQNFASIMYDATGEMVTLGSQGSPSQPTSPATSAASATSSGAQAGDQPSTSSDSGDQSSSTSTSDSSSESAGDSSSKSYEVSEKNSASGGQSNMPIVAIIGVLILVGLIGVGYFHGRK